MAIAYDNSTAPNYRGPGASSLTYSHTCSGVNRILFVGVWGSNGGSDTITGVTYGGVSMTRIASTSAGGDRRVYLYYLIAPSTGANNVIVSMSVAEYLGSVAVSYTGAKQTGQPDASTTLGSTTTATTATLSVTTVADNCWTVLWGRVVDATGHPTAGSGSHLVCYDNLDGTGFFDSNTSLTPAGSKSMTINWTPSKPYNLVMASFSPAADENNSKFFQLF